MGECRVMIELHWTLFAGLVAASLLVGVYFGKSYFDAQRRVREERDEIASNAYWEYIERGGKEGDEQGYSCRCGNVVFVDSGDPSPTCTGLPGKEHAHRVMHSIEIDI